MSTKAKLEKLNSVKLELETKIAQNGDILAANGDVGMTGPIVDNDGFPRNDIDIYQVRQARQQIICLQNDYKELMKQIHNLLNEYYSEVANGSTTADSGKSNVNVTEKIQNTTETASTVAKVELKTLVIVNLVSPNSPAEDAGLKVGDHIVEFGTINSNNFNNDLNQIGTVVRHMQNQRISLKVKRDGELLDMILIPKTWGGRGLLGCNIVLPKDF